VQRVQGTCIATRSRVIRTRFWLLGAAIGGIAGFVVATDRTIALLSEGYTFIGGRARRYQSDAFDSRLMLRRAVCTVGEEAARMVYAPGRFTRKGAVPFTAWPAKHSTGAAATSRAAAGYSSICTARTTTRAPGATPQCSVRSVFARARPAPLP
jgi:hypothetical protein